MLRSRLEAGDIYVSDSLRFRSFDEDLTPMAATRGADTARRRRAGTGSAHGANAAGA